MKKPVEDWPLSRVVEVTWRDSAARGDWRSLEEHRSLRGVGPIRSVGFLLTQDDDVIQLAQSQSAMTGCCSDTVTIPRENVVKIRRMK